ncbi:MAG: helix-hairpin-helix domain-containing protein [Burkholderiaceae bacterium]
MKKILVSLLVAGASALLLPPTLAQSSASGAGKSGMQTPASAKLDINSASATELEGLKGIGPARSAAIIDGRPYRGKDELVKRRIIPQSVYDEISDQIIARQK